MIVKQPTFVDERLFSLFYCRLVVGEMGCGTSTSSATAPAARPGSHDSDKARKQSVFEANIPIIPLTKGSAVQFQPPPNTRIIFIFGGYIITPSDKLID